jgi:beta-lactamase superfamily II metal-dependent hydrolase
MKRLLAIALAVVLAGTLPAAQSGEVVTPSDRVVDSVAVREEASGQAAALGRLRKGERATLLLSVPSWYRIRLANGVKGFVPKSWTTRVAQTLAGPVATGQDIPFKVHFLDVGTGDSAIIDIGDKEIVIDGGNSSTILKKYVTERQIIDGPIELVVVTHGDTDHWKGLQRLMNFDNKAPNPPKVLEFWEPGYDRDCNGANHSGRAGYLNFISRFLAVPGVTIRRPLQSTHPPADQTGQVQPFTLPSIPGVTFTVLHSAAAPTSDNSECSYLINNASSVLKLQIGVSTFLFTGDANGKERNDTNAANIGHVERGLVQLDQKFPGTLKVDVLKAPHHGSETASSTPFIAATNPRFAVFSASTSHHLPKETVVHRYEAPGRVILTTDDHHKSNEDHIVCIKNVGEELDCNYESVLAEGGVIQ